MDGVSAIDGDITKIGDKYHLFYVAHDGVGGIKQAVSDRMNGGYVYDARWYDFEPKACEAPNVWKRIGENKWVLMYDISASLLITSVLQKLPILYISRTWGTSMKES